MNIYKNTFVVITLLGLMIIWLSIPPTIAPEDILISGKLKKYEETMEPRLPGGQGYVIEVSLNKKTSKPLYTSDKEYFYYIYPLAKDFQNAGWDFYKGFDDDGKPIGAEQFTFGTDSRTLNPAIKKLSELGIIDGFSETKLITDELTGFLYTGNQFPVKVRFYLSPTGQLSKPREAFLIYSHYEQKWGKNLSWTQVFPVSF